MEAERILVDGIPCSVRIATPRELSTILDHDPFELLVIDIDLVEPVSPLIRRRQLAGAGVVLTTLVADDAGWVEHLPGCALVAKPFVDDELLAAVKAALPVAVGSR